MTHLNMWLKGSGLTQGNENLVSLTTQNKRKMSFNCYWWNPRLEELLVISLPQMKKLYKEIFYVG